MPYFYVKVRKNIDICNFLNGYYCHFYGVRGLFQCPLKGERQFDFLLNKLIDNNLHLLNKLIDKDLQ